MHFIQSHRANESQPINLEHVVAFDKDFAGSTTMIVFDTSSSERILWKYYKNKANRDLDYEDIMLIIGMSEQEDNP